MSEEILEKFREDGVVGERLCELNNYQLEKYGVAPGIRRAVLKEVKAEHRRHRITHHMFEYTLTVLCTAFQSDIARRQQIWDAFHANERRKQATKLELEKVQSRRRRLNQKRARNLAAVSDLPSYLKPNCPCIHCPDQLFKP